MLPDISRFPDVLPDALRSQLAPGEQVLWQGHPRQGLVLHASDALLMPFALLWCGFIAFWEWQVLRTGAGWFFVLWGVPFVLLGLYMLAGRFWVDARRRARTHYAVTNERVLIASGDAIEALPLRSLPCVRLRPQARGRGSIALAFNSRTPGAGMWAAFPPGWPGVPPNGPVLEGVADAQRVASIIRDAQRRPT